MPKKTTDEPKEQQAAPEPAPGKAARERNPGRRAGDAFFGLVAGVSLGLFIACTIAFQYRPDALAAITVWPVWAWAALGLWLAVTGGRAPKLAGWLAATLWMLFLLTYAEEPRSLWRGAFPPKKTAAPEGAVTLRVVTLNCAVGNALAAVEALAPRPDIALLQESPSKSSLEATARAAYGPGASVVWSPGCSIVVRPGIEVLSSGYGGQPFVLARLRLPNGALIEAWSLRLTSACISIDLWRRSCWEDHRENHFDRRNQMRYLLQALSLVPQRRPIVIGGDFNAPGDDSAMWGMKPRMTDVFRKAGTGWGNTMLNEIPIARIDQIWTSGRFEPISARAVKSGHSDHRAAHATLRLLPPDPVNERRPTSTNQR